MADWLFPDLCVIGAGAGGIAAAERAVRLGAGVVLVEARRFGGDGQHLGAVPALGLVEAGNRAALIREAESFGIDVAAGKPVFRRVHQRIDDLIARVAPASAAPRLEALGIKTLRGEGRFIDRRTLLVGETHVRARRFLVATGSAPLAPSVPGINDVPFFTTDSILDNTRKLTHLLIEGVTPLTLELGQAFCRLGSEVTLVDPAPRLLPELDEEMSRLLIARIAREGVRILHGTTLVELVARSMGIGARIRSATTETLLDISHVLVATERRPRLDGLGLELAGVLRAKGDPTRLRLRPGGRTTNGLIFFLGGPDGTDSMLAARAQGAALAERLVTGFGPMPDLRALPRLMRTDPALASVGLSEADALRRYGPSRVTVTRLGYSGNDRAIAADRADGVVRVLTGPGGRLLGASALGPEAGELIALVSLALSRRMTAAALGSLLAPYGTHAALLAGLAGPEDTPLRQFHVSVLRQIRRFFASSSQRPR